MLLFLSPNNIFSRADCRNTTNWPENLLRNFAVITWLCGNPTKITPTSIIKEPPAMRVFSPYHLCSALLLSCAVSAVHAAMQSDEQIMPGLTILRRGEAANKAIAGDAVADSGVSFKSVDVSVEVNGLLARTTIKQVLQNDSKSPQKAAVTFPLPPHAAVESFSMTLLDEKVLVDSVQIHRNDAQSKFRQIVDDPLKYAPKPDDKNYSAEMIASSTASVGTTSFTTGPMIPVAIKDPGLVELLGPATCRTTMFPIEAGKTKTLVLTYVQSLQGSSAASDTLSYTFPLAVWHDSSTAKTNTRLAAMIHGAQSTLSCNSAHVMVFETTGTTASTYSCNLSGKDACAEDWSFDIKSRTANEIAGKGCAIQTCRPDAQREGALALTVIPQAPTTHKPIDVVFIVDVSAARNDAERKLISTFVRSAAGALDASARYNVLTLGRNITFLHKAFTTPAATIDATMANLEQTGAEGIADLVSGFAVLRKHCQPSPDRALKIVFIGDVCTERRETSAILESVGQALKSLNADLYAVRPSARAAAVHESMLDFATLCTGNTLDLVPAMDLSSAARDLITRAAAAVLRNASISIATEKGIACTLIGMPYALSMSQPQTVFGSFTATGPATVTLRGTLNGAVYQKNWQVELPTQTAGSPSLGRLYARILSEYARSDAAAWDASQSALKAGALEKNCALLVTEVEGRMKHISGDAKSMDALSAEVQIATPAK
jgi:hypothetical protein